MIKIGTPESIGEANKKLILNHLRLKGDMSRADLTREIRMSFPAVSSNIRYLLEKGYIKEIGAGDNSVGRKSKLLSFNARRGFVIGVVIGRHETRYMLADLLGNAVANRIRPNKPGESGARIVKSVVGAVEKLVGESGVGDRNILAVCVGVPGIVHGNERKFVTPRVIDFSLEELRASLERMFRVGMLVENDVNLGAIGETWRGVGARYTDLVYIGYGVGLGAALILGGRLYKGVDGAAGEVGFMTVDPKRLHHRFVETGSLANLISERRINSSLAGKDFMTEMADLLRDGKNGRPRTNRIIEKVSQYFGMVLINICALVNPQAIIVSGDIGRILGECFGPSWEAMLESHLPFPPEIVFSRLNGRESLLGATYTALEHIYNAPVTV